MNENLLKLKDINLSNSNPSEIDELLNKTLKGMPMPIQSFIFRSGSSIFRGRCIENIDEIKSDSDISYLPAEKCQRYQRANIPHSTMFYAVSGERKSTSTAGCLGEICDCLRYAEVSPKRYLIAIGEWVAKEDIVLPIFPTLSGGNKSSILNGDIERYNNLIEEHGCYDFKEFLEYISLEYKKRANSESDYWVTAMFSKLLMNYRRNSDGLAYESTQIIDPKLNDVICLAIKPESVDNKLTCKGVDFYEFAFVDIHTPIFPTKIHSIEFSK